MQTRPASFFRLLTISLGLMAVGAHAAAPIARPAIAIENPPPVQLLVPGFLPSTLLPAGEGPVELIN
jgi:hypothetical protein